jgi:hypothetical protein
MFHSTWPSSGVQVAVIKKLLLTVMLLCFSYVETSSDYAWLCGLTVSLFGLLAVAVLNALVGAIFCCVVVGHHGRSLKVCNLHHTCNIFRFELFQK